MQGGLRRRRDTAALVWGAAVSPTRTRGGWRGTCVRQSRLREVPSRGRLRGQRYAHTLGVSCWRGHAILHTRCEARTGCSRGEGGKEALSARAPCVVNNKRRVSPRLLRGRGRTVGQTFADLCDGSGGVICDGSYVLRLGFAGCCTKRPQETPSLNCTRLLAPMPRHAMVRANLGGMHDAITANTLTIRSVTSSARLGRGVTKSERHRVGACLCSAARPEGNSLAELLDSALWSSNGARRMGDDGSSTVLGKPAGTRVRIKGHGRPSRSP